MTNEDSNLVRNRAGKLAYAKPALVAYGLIADFTAGGSGTVQENAGCNQGSPNPLRQTKC